MVPFFIIGEDGKHQILLYDVIGDFYWEVGITAKQIIQALAAVDENDEVKVRINCRGGFTDEGTAIYNALADRPGYVECCIEGYASSMATVVMGAGDKTTAYETAMGMTHKAIGNCYGNADDMREQAEVLDKVTDQIALAYSRKMGCTPEEAKELLLTSKDEWRTAAELEEIGLVDEVITPHKFTLLTSDKGVQALEEGEGAALIKPDQMPKGLLSQIEGVEGVVALRVDKGAVSLTRLRTAPAAVDDPPADDPPADDPPADDPPADDPPADDPPADDPPADDPPADDLPADDPPAEDPPAEDPPAEDPPADDPSADDPSGDEPEDPVAKERKRVSAIMAMLKKNGMDVNGGFAAELLSSDVPAQAAGQRIHDFKAELSNHTPAPQDTPASDAEKIQASWGKAYNL